MTIFILGKVVGKNKDDVCLLLHLILRNMATKTPNQCQAFFSLRCSQYDSSISCLHSKQYAGVCQSVVYQCQGTVREVF